MPLPAPVQRTPMHARTIECTGYRRADGLWDIEGRMTDKKTYAVHSDYRTVEAGGAFNDMTMRLVVDDTLLIHAVNACIDAGPYGICAAVTHTFRRLVGLRIEAGFTAELRRRVGGVEGCVHLRDLCRPLARVAEQTILPLRRAPQDSKSHERPQQIDRCYALAATGEVVARYWPRFGAAQLDNEVKRR